MSSQLPTAECLNARNSSLRDFKNVISLAHYQKIVSSMVISAFQQERLAAMCVAYNALSREQQREQNVALLHAEDDFAVFTDENGYTIIQHEPSISSFKVLGYDGVRMSIHYML